MDAERRKKQQLDDLRRRIDEIIKTSPVLVALNKIKSPSELWSIAPIAASLKLPEIEPPLVPLPAGTDESSKIQMLQERIRRDEEVIINQEAIIKSLQEYIAELSKHFKMDHIQ